MSTGAREAQGRTDENKLPGQIFSLNEQCKHIYDERSYFCEVRFEIIFLLVFKRNNKESLDSVCLSQELSNCYEFLKALSKI